MTEKIVMWLFILVSDVIISQDISNNYVIDTRVKRNPEANPKTFEFIGQKKLDKNPQITNIVPLNKVFVKPIVQPNIGIQSTNPKVITYGQTRLANNDKDRVKTNKQKGNNINGIENKDKIILSVIKDNDLRGKKEFIANDTKFDRNRTDIKIGNTVLKEPFPGKTMVSKIKSKEIRENNDINLVEDENINHNVIIDKSGQKYNHPYFVKENEEKNGITTKDATIKADFDLNTDPNILIEATNKTPDPDVKQNKINNNEKYDDKINEIIKILLKTIKNLNNTGLAEPQNINKSKVNLEILSNTAKDINAVEDMNNKRNKIDSSSCILGKEELLKNIEYIPVLVSNKVEDETEKILIKNNKFEEIYEKLHKEENGELVKTIIKSEIHIPDEVNSTKEDNKETTNLFKEIFYKENTKSNSTILSNENKNQDSTISNNKLSKLNNTNGENDVHSAILNHPSNIIHSQPAFTQSQYWNAGVPYNSYYYNPSNIYYNYPYYMYLCNQGNPLTGTYPFNQVWMQNHTIPMYFQNWNGFNQLYPPYNNLPYSNCMNEHPIMYQLLPNLIPTANFDNCSKFNPLDSKKTNETESINLNNDSYIKNKTNIDSNESENGNLNQINIDNRLNLHKLNNIAKVITDTRPMNNLNNNEKLRRCWTNTEVRITPRNVNFINRADLENWKQYLTRKQ